MLFDFIVSGKKGFPSWVSQGWMFLPHAPSLRAGGLRGLGAGMGLRFYCRCSPTWDRSKYLDLLRMGALTGSPKWLRKITGDVTSAWVTKVGCLKIASPPTCLLKRHRKEFQFFCAQGEKSATRSPRFRWLEQRPAWELQIRVETEGGRFS